MNQDSKTLTFLVWGWHPGTGSSLKPPPAQGIQLVLWLGAWLGMENGDLTGYTISICLPVKAAKIPAKLASSEFLLGERTFFFFTPMLCFIAKLLLEHWG